MDNPKKEREGFTITNNIIKTANVFFSQMSETEDDMTRYLLFSNMLRILSVSAMAYLKNAYSNEIEKMESALDACKKRLMDEGNNEENQTDIIKHERELAFLHQGVKDIEELTESVSKYMKGLDNWIKTPMYSPDHPYGNKMMRSAEDDLKKKASPNEKDKDDN